MNDRFRLGAVTVCLAFAIAGCGESWQAATHPASGRVSINGKAPVGALVQLVPAGPKPPDERNSRPWGVVDPDGRYELSTYDGEPGAPVGDYVFTITWPLDISKPSLSDRLHWRYGRPDQSKWKLTIKEGKNDLPLVEMTGVEVDTKVDSTPSTGPLGPAIVTKAGKRRR